MNEGCSMGWKAMVAAAMLAVSGVTGALAQPALNADFAKERPSADARFMAEWVLENRDHGHRPFVIVDKRDARVFFFHSDGRLAGASPALLGSTRGDHSVPGVGERAQQGQVGLTERTTPAGRFVTQPGRNLEGEHVVWVDYSTAFAIHRVRDGASRDRRLARLASSSARDKRTSLGCVVVPVAFYEDVVQPMLGNRRGVVYVLPETQSVQELFGAL
jgi:hypothetical protein